MKRVLVCVAMLAVVAFVARPGWTQTAGDGGTVGDGGTGGGGVTGPDGGVDTGQELSVIIRFELGRLQRGEITGAQFGAVVQRLATAFGPPNDGGIGDVPGCVPGGADGGGGGFGGAPDGGL